MSNLTRFNTQVENLLNDLTKIFPDFIDLKIFREKFNIVKSTNPKLILLVFLKYAYPYKKKVLDQDEAFFLSDDLTQEVTNNKDIQKDGNVDSDYILTKALGIKELWSIMTDQQKQTVWTYFKVLMVLCERYVAESMK